MCYEAWPASATLLSSNALKQWPCRGRPQPQAPSVLSSAHLCYRLFLKMWYYCVKNAFWRIGGGGGGVKYYPKPPKICMTIFRLVANKGLTWTLITISRINLFAWAIFLHGKRCNMYRVYFWTIFWTNGKWNWKTQGFLIEYCNTIYS